MKIYFPPYDIYEKNDDSISLKDKGFSVFLAGSIEMGVSDNWQGYVIDKFKNKDITFLNPRRAEWNSDWKQEIENLEFKEQVEWELNGLEASDLIVVYFDPKTKSPISLMELGLFAKSKKIVVCCPNGFWRKGNVDIVCERYNIKRVNTIDELIKEIDNYAN